MSVQQAVSLLSVSFLAGVVMVFISPLPPLRQRFPKLLFYGFAVAVVSVVLVLVAALLFSWATPE